MNTRSPAIENLRRLLRAGLALGGLALGLQSPGAATQLLPGVHGFGLDRSVNSAGFGANAVVIEVTNLNDSGAGSLREALAQDLPGNAPRIVVFTLSGVIEVRTNLTASKAHTTIAGQTAPAPGIAIHGAGLSVAADNILVQHLRVRPGDAWNDNYRLNARDATTIGGRGVITNVVFDHCTFMFASDETAECYSHYGNITFNKCIFAEPLNIAVHLDEGTLPGNGLIPPQAESLASAVSGAKIDDKNASELAIGGNYQVVTPAADGDWIEYTFLLNPIKTARTHVYPLVAGIKGPNRGQFRLEAFDAAGNLLNPEGSKVVFDQFAPVESLENFIQRDHEITIPAGAASYRVRLISAGRNPASSGRTLGVDQLSLTQAHGFGPLFSSGRDGAGRLAILNSIIASSVGRNPWVASKQGVIANNVLYNRMQLFAQVLNPQANDAKWVCHIAFLGNTFIEGPSKPDWAMNSPINRSSGHQNGQAPNPVEHSSIFAEDNDYNFGDWESPPPLLSPAFAADGYLAPSNPITYTEGMQGFVPQPAARAYADVIADAGAFPAARDVLETRIIREISTSVSIPALASRLGSIKHTVTEAGGWPVYARNKATWTLPKNPNQDSGNGYTNIEVWLQGLAAVAERGGG